MKTGFNNPIEPKESKKINSPWNFSCPPYDERSSCYVNSGSHYGVGHKQPVGSSSHSMKGSVPVGRGVNTMKISEIPKKNLKIGIEE